MEIIKANITQKNQVLKILDEFRTVTYAIARPDENIVYTTAQDEGGKIFDQVINSPNMAIFLAMEDDLCAGVLIIHKFPQIRKATYCDEIDDMYVAPEFQGKGVAQQLMIAAEAWAKKEGISNIRLESGDDLKRAHAFYEKVGLVAYGKAFRKKFD